MKVYTRFIITNYLKSFINVILIVFCLVLILNLLTEIEFFRDTNVSSYFTIYISLLNSPSLVFEMLPFIFLVSTQVFFINLFKNQQIQTFKYSGLRNSSILNILIVTSFFMGILSITLFYNLSSNLKNIYLEIKNSYTTDYKYLDVITNNGLWIKDNVNDKTNIVNASKIDDVFLLDTTITEFESLVDMITDFNTVVVDVAGTSLENVVITLQADYTNGYSGVDITPFIYGFTEASNPNPINVSQFIPLKRQQSNVDINKSHDYMMLLDEINKDIKGKNYFNPSAI